ncbi:MAG: polyprenyl synthetase family protein [Deltaproteobacteria bacterium]|jgi:geranylgeranyl diphosphate synthase type II|nr:polyprenyl synthetase family protein [Deltaproteobacteria bacterium]
MTQSEFESWRKSRTEMIDEALADYLDKLSAGQPPDILRLMECIRYSLLGGGKRIRPLLALAAGEALGGEVLVLVPPSIALEMIHAYSLIHDDLPALDNDDLRRGRPSCHKAFGEATAILAGDALQSLAFQVLGNLAAKPILAKKGGRAIYALAKAIGPLGMAGGQAEDLAFEKKTPTLEENAAMGQRKTGELMAASLEIGAIMAGADRETQLRFREIGLLAGKAYQIIDDLLNQIGDPVRLGKAVGSDAQKGKSTVPALLGQEEARAQAEALIEEAVQLANRFSSARLPDLLKFLVSRDS